MKDLIAKVCLVWDTFDTFVFLSTHVSKKYCVYKLSQATNPVAKLIKTTQFFSIYKVSNKGMETPVGYIFVSITNNSVSLTNHALASRFNVNSYKIIKQLGRQELWNSLYGIRLINYDNTAEVITDLGDIFEISLIK